jgi:hypothetical protein
MRHRAVAWFEICSLLHRPNEPTGHIFALGTQARYRAYTLDEDGHIIGCEPVVCAGDDEAIASAERLLDGRDLELWAGVRLIILLEPPSKA